MPAFRFHDRRGANIQFYNDQQTATLQGNSSIGGIIMSDVEMEVNRVYAVTISRDKPPQQFPVMGPPEPSISVGLVTESPSNLQIPLPASALAWQNAVVVTSDSFTDRGADNPQSEGHSLLSDFHGDARVGVSIDNSRCCLKLHIDNGNPIEFRCKELPKSCWAMWELRGTYNKATVLP